MEACSGGSITRRDRALAEDIIDLLAHDRRFEGQRISLDVRGGVAHVRGAVRSDEQRALLRRVIGRVRGVHAVWDVLHIGDEDDACIVDIGCGGKKQHAWSIGVDRHCHDGVDVVTNLERGLPFAARSVDQIFAVHFLEHVHALLGLMNEIHRVLKPTGVLHAMVPNCQFVNAISDPTHVRFFNHQTFKFFCRPYPGLRLFRPLAISSAADNIFADLTPVHAGEPLASEQELARYFD